MLIVGTFDEMGCPAIRIRVRGDLDVREYIATVDTGFSGFVALPLAEMVPLGLSTKPNAASVMLGNGQIIDNLIADAEVFLSGQSANGSILLDETSGDVLAGMGLLRAFGLALVVTETTVVLHDKAETLEVVAQFMQTAPIGLPNTSPTSTSKEG